MRGMTRSCQSQDHSLKAAGEETQQDTLVSYARRGRGSHSFRTGQLLGVSAKACVFWT